MSSIPKMQNARSKSKKEIYHKALYKKISQHPYSNPLLNLVSKCVPYENLNGTSCAYFSIKYLVEEINRSKDATSHLVRLAEKNNLVIIIDNYELINGKKKQVTSSWILAPTVFAYGTPFYEQALAWTIRFKEKHKRPSVEMQKPGISPSDAFATCTRYRVLNTAESPVDEDLKFLVSLKAHIIAQGGEGCKLPALTISSNTSNISKYTNITSMPDKPQSRGLIKQESNLIPEELKSPPKRNRHKVSEHYHENKKIVEALDFIFREFERLCFRTLSILEQHRFAGKLRERIAAGEGSFEQFVNLFKFSLKEIESSSVLRNSLESTLGRLYEAKKLKQFVFATDKARDNLVELHSDAPEKIPELLAIQAYEWGSNPQAVITDYFGDDVARDLFNESRDPIETVSIEEPVKGEDMHQECRREPSNDEELHRDDFMTIEEIAEEIACEENAKRKPHVPSFVPRSVPEVIIEPKVDFNPHNQPIQRPTPCKEKSPRELATDAVVAHLVYKLKAPTYEPRLRSLLEQADLHFIMHLYDNPGLIIIELMQAIKKSA